jgi:hypothetical protein
MLSFLLLAGRLSRAVMTVIALVPNTSKSILRTGRRIVIRADVIGETAGEAFMDGTKPSRAFAAGSCGSTEPDWSEETRLIRKEVTTPGDNLPEPL